MVKGKLNVEIHHWEWVRAPVKFCLVKHFESLEKLDIFQKQSFFTFIYVIFSYNF